MTRAWAWEHARGMRKALVVRGRMFGARTGLVAERGVASSPASGVVRAGTRYGLRYLAQKDGQEIRVLTELENVGDGRAKSTGALTGGVVWTGARGRGRCSGVPASVLHG